MKNRYTEFICEECQEIFMVENDVSKELTYWGISYRCPECDTFDESPFNTPENENSFLILEWIT